MIEVLNEQGVKFEIQVIRFFEYKNNQYLIYTSNEKDNAGYVKLFLTKNENGFFSKVEDETEWNTVKDLIKSIIKEAKTGDITSAQDLDYKRLFNQTILGAKTFKLADSVVEMLTFNKKQFADVEIIQEENQNEEEATVSLNSFDLEEDSNEAKSYEELLAQIKSLKSENTIVDDQPTPVKPTANVDSLEALLGTNEVLKEPSVKIENETSKEEPMPTNDLLERVDKLEKKVEELNKFIDKLKEATK